MSMDLLLGHDPSESFAPAPEPAPGRSSTSHLAGRGGGAALYGLAAATQELDDELAGVGDDADDELADPFGLHLLGEEDDVEEQAADDALDAMPAEGAEGGGLDDEDDEQGDGEGELRSASRHLADVVAEGESKLGAGGDPYTARNSGTQGGKIVGTRYEKGLDRMTLAQIRARRNAGGTNRLFAVGKYQIIPDTLQLAMNNLKLKGNEVFDATLQDRIFIEYLILGGKQPLLSAFLKSGAGSVQDAVYGAAKEWASIEVPAGRATNKSGVSNGRKSYWGGANGAKAGSGARVGAAIQRMREAIVKVFGTKPLDRAAVRRVGAIATGKGAETSTTERETPTTTKGDTTTTKGDTTTSTRTAEREPTPAIPGGLTGTVGRGGANAPDEVGRVQERLAAIGISPGPIDRKMGPRTIAAIEAAQRALGMKRPDGLVEPGKRTERGLFGTDGALLGVVEVRADDDATTETSTTETSTTETKTSSTKQAEVKPSKPVAGKPLPVKAGVTMTSYLTQMSALLQPYVPRGVRVSSGLRSTEKQRQILRGLWAKHRGPSSITDEVAQCRWLRGRGVHVAPPGRSNHEKGRAIDLSGAALGTIEAAVDRAGREHPGNVVKTLQEPRQGCVHVDLAGGS